MKKTKTNIIIVIITLIILAGALVNIFTLFNKKENNKDTTNTFTATTTSETTTSGTTIPATTKTVVKTTKKVVKKVNTNNNTTGKYKITHYGPDCRGCSGITASGYNVKNTIWYNDATYGQVRIVATGNKFKLYSIIKIKNYKLGEITAIVLDRGVSGNVIDLLVKSESVATQLGIQNNVEIEVLRNGK